MRALHHLARGNHDLALADLKQADESPIAGYYTRYQAALVTLKIGEFSEYRTACQKMLKQFANSEVPNELHFTAWTCVLAADAVDDYSPAIDLARRAFETAPDFAFHQQCLGAVLNLRSWC